MPPRKARTQTQTQTQTQAQEAPQAPTASGLGLPPAHRFAFLQALMARSWLSEDNAKRIFDELNQAAGGEYTYTHTVADINYELNDLLLAVSQLKYPVDGRRYVALVNKENDEVARQNGTSFSVAQVQYLRALVEAIAMDPEAEDGVATISGIDAMNINFSDTFTQATQASQAVPKALTMNEKDDLLDKFVSEGWLSTVAGIEGHYTLGVRTFMELGNQLLDFDLPEATRSAWEQIL